MKEQCEPCHLKLDFPKKPPDTPITSMEFGERILIDLKELPRRQGYLAVAVDHWSSYCWLMYLKTKHADGVAKFLESVVFRDIKLIREGWRKSREEAQTARRGGTSYPVNPEAAKTDTTGALFTVSVFEEHKDILEVSGRRSAPLRTFGT